MASVDLTDDILYRRTTPLALTFYVLVLMILGYLSGWVQGRQYQRQNPAGHVFWEK